MSALKSLRELVIFRGGGTPSKQVAEYWNGNIPWATVKDFTSTSLSETQDFISDEGLKNSSANIITKGHVIIPTRMSLGKAAINTIDLAINQDLRALIPKVNLHPQFLLHAVLSLKNEIVKKGAGATVKGITQEELYNFQLAVPPLNDQIRIAHLLGKVEGLITRRKQHLEQLDALLKSVFLEMFGDPVRNEKGWDKVQFSELLDGIDSGKSPKCEAREATADEWGVLKLGAVTRCAFNEHENKALPSSITPTKRDEVRAGDLLFSRKNTYDLVAACAYIFETRSQLLMPDLIFRLVFKDTAEVDKIFMWKLLIADSQRKAIQSLAAGAAGSMPNISKANLKSVQLPIPPLSLQNQFAAIVQKVEALKTRYHDSLTDLETLYAALSQKAFKGELDLSRIPLPAIDLNPNPMEGDTAVSAELEVPIAFAFPDLGLPVEVLANETGLLKLLLPWLEHCHAHRGAQPFVAQDFLDAAQSRLEEIYPDGELELGMAAYEHIKHWVFESLGAKRLEQGFDAASKRITLKAVHA